MSLRGNVGLHKEHGENTGCTCDLCKNPKAKEVVKYFNDLNKGEAIAHNCYVTKGNLSKFIKAKKLARINKVKLMKKQALERT